MGVFSKKFEAVQADAALIDQIAGGKPSGEMVKIRPYPEKDDSLSASQQLLKTVYNTINTSVFGMVNTSTVSTFEIWYTGNEVEFRYYIEEESLRSRLLKQIGGLFPNANAAIVDDHFVPIQEGEWIAGGRFHLNRHYFEPIQTENGRVGMEHDPYKTIIQDVTAKADAKVIVQVCMRPATKDWTSTLRKDVGQYSEAMKSNDTVEVLEGLQFKEYEVGAPEHLRKAADDIAAQRGKPAFHVNLRMLAVAPTKQEALEQVESLGGIYAQTHQSVTGQTLVARPQQADELYELINDTLARRGRYMDIPQNPASIASRKLNRYFRGGSYETMVMTMPEVASLAHIPDQSINSSDVNWARNTIPGTIPPTAERFEDFHRSDSVEEAIEEESDDDPWDIDEQESDDEDLIDEPIEEFIE